MSAKTPTEPLAFTGRPLNPHRLRKVPPKVPPKPKKKPVDILGDVNGNTLPCPTAEKDGPSPVPVVCSVVENTGTEQKPEQNDEHETKGERNPEQNGKGPKEYEIQKEIGEGTKDFEARIPEPATVLETPFRSPEVIRRPSQGQVTRILQELESGVESGPLDNSSRRESLQSHSSDIILKSPELPLILRTPPTHNGCSSTDQDIALPERYLARIRQRTSRRILGSLEDIAEDSDSRDSSADTEDTDSSFSPYISDNLEDREKDLEVAIKWLRQEILQMKEQDRNLMRRLLELRAHVHHIRGLSSSHSISSTLLHVGTSSSDLNAYNWTSFMSLDEDVLGHALPAPSFSQGDVGQDFLQARGLGRSVSTRTRPLHSPPIIRRKQSLPSSDIDEDQLEEEYFLG